MELTMRDASAPSVLRPREFAKSSKTRLRILESAVQCLVEVGYAKMSTGLVAARAKIARSALQYHFPTRHDLVVALVRHVHYERSRKYAEEIAAAGAREGAAVDIYWQHVQGRLFVAYSELHFAARTDRELSEIIEPVFLEYERDRVEISRRIYPELWSQKPQAFDLYRDVTRFLVEGMALSTIAYRRQERVAGVLEFVKATRRNLMAEAAEPKAPAGEPAAKPKRLRKANR
jgi:AcrR family transcriptional regulator